MGDLIQIFIDNIAPILIISAIGYGIGRRYAIDPRPMGRIIYFIFSPSLLFTSLARNRVSITELLQISGVMLLIVVIIGLISYVMAQRQSHKRAEQASVVLSAICPNTGNFGLPLIGFAFNEAILARAVIAYIVLTISNYSLGVFVASSGDKSLGDALRNILKVPLIYAAFAGLMVNFLDIQLPLVLDRSLNVMSQATIPCMIVLLGMQLAQSKGIQQLNLVGLGAILRLLLAPIVAVVLTQLFNLSLDASIAIIMQASMPVAVVTTILAAEFGLDDKVASGTILISTVASPITLSVLILLLQRWAGIT